MNMYTVCHAYDARNARSDALALLFNTPDTKKIAGIPELSEIYPNGYFVTSISDIKSGDPYRHSYYQRQRYSHNPAPYTMVSIFATYPRPDEAKLNSEDICFFVNGKTYQVNLRTRYNHCLSLFKAVGCAQCPDNGLPCVSQEAEELIELDKKLTDAERPVYFNETAFSNNTEFLNDIDDIEFLKYLQRKHPSLGDFKLVKPGSTSPRSFHSTFRPYWDHDFSLVPRNEKEKSDAASRAARTRKFKKEECPQCVIKDSCSNASRCDGRYPPQETIIKQANAELTAAIAGSILPEWAIWEVARGAGQTAKHSRWHIMLTGILLDRYGNGSLRATVHRAKTDIDEYKRLNTYEEIAEVFNLAKTEKDVPPERGPLRSFELRAVWWLALLARSTARRATGWGGSRYVVSIGVDEKTGISLEWTNGRDISHWHSNNLRKIEDVSRCLTPNSLYGVAKEQFVQR
jgi:hypothetical protein